EHRSLWKSQSSPGHWATGRSGTFVMNAATILRSTPSASRLFELHLRFWSNGGPSAINFNGRYASLSTVLNGQCGTEPTMFCGHWLPPKLSAVFSKRLKLSQDGRTGLLCGECQQKASSFPTY